MHVLILDSEGAGASGVILVVDKGIAPALLDLGAPKGCAKAAGRAAAGGAAASWVLPGRCLDSVALAYYGVSDA